MMKFLFETIAFRSEKPIYYRIYQVNDGEFYAERVNEGSETPEFFFRKKGNQWLVDDPFNEDVCDQIGEEGSVHERRIREI